MQNGLLKRVSFDWNDFSHRKFDLVLVEVSITSYQAHAGRMMCTHGNEHTTFEGTV